MTRRNELDLERDCPLDAEDRASLERARRIRFDPTQAEWQWISLALQFPGLRQSRTTAAGREEFRLPAETNTRLRPSEILAHRDADRR